MNKNQKLESLFNSEDNLLLSDFLAPAAVRTELMKALDISNEADLLNELGVDFYYLSFRDLSQNESLLPFYKGPDLFSENGVRKCPFGISWKRAVGSDKFSVDEAIDGPFTAPDITEDDILAYKWPDPKCFDYTELKKEADSFGNKIIIGGLWSAIHGDSNRMMGYENFLLNIALNRPLVKTLVDRVTQYYLEANELYFEALQGSLDIYFMGNDFGSQNGLLISVEDWVDIYYENYKKLIDQAHDYGLKVMVHSCGAIIELLPYFVELGVDILDPVQITAHNMNPASLSEHYGDKIIFHGAIDTQHLLPDSKPDEVYDECSKIIKSFTDRGSFIAAPSNNILPGTPVENIFAFYKATKDIKNANYHSF